MPGPLALCQINAAASAHKTSVGGLAAGNNPISATGAEEGEYISKTATVFDGGEDFHHFRDEANPSIDRMSLSPCSGLGKIMYGMLQNHSHYHNFARRMPEVFLREMQQEFRVCRMAQWSRVPVI